MATLITPRRTFDDLVQNCPPEVARTANVLRRLVRAAAPDADESIYGGTKAGLVLYSVGGGTKVFCGIQPGGQACMLYLHRIASSDAPGLRIEGEGKHARHVRFRSAMEIPEKAVSAVLALARQRLC